MMPSDKLMAHSVCFPVTLPKITWLLNMNKWTILSWICGTSVFPFGNTERKAFFQHHTTPSIFLHLPPDSRVNHTHPVLFQFTHLRSLIAGLTVHPSTFLPRSIIARPVSCYRIHEDCYKTFLAPDPSGINTAWTWPTCRHHILHPSFPLWRVPC